MKRARCLSCLVMLPILACTTTRIGWGENDGAAPGNLPDAGQEPWQGGGGESQAGTGGDRPSPIAEAGVPIGSGGSAGEQILGTGGILGAGGTPITRPDGGSGGSRIIQVPWDGSTPPVARNKVDLLFMIDNSSSMADKQQMLATAVPALLERYLRPICVSAGTGAPATQPTPGGVCPEGTRREFDVTDLHVGIVSSSLGGHGAPGICDDEVAMQQKISDPRNNDQAHLLTRGLNSGGAFLSWTAGSDPSVIAQTFAQRVVAVGQHGCGYESQLESVYRFLVDPAPPADVRLTNIDGMDRIEKVGVDTTLLKERSAFLRPDSLVMIVVVSDEDDCSINEDEPQAWLSLATPINQRSPLRPGTSACATDPNDRCCFNCAMALPPEGCPRPREDPACVANGSDRVFTSDENPANLRCWRQKQRFGVDFLYPVSRYVEGFSQPQVWDARSQRQVTNPLFQDLNCTGDCPAVRDPGSVLFTAIVGVPWQDLARNPHDLSQGYKSPAELHQSNAWSTILGSPEASPPGLPGDPLMIDSVQPRRVITTSNPLGAVALPAPIDGTANANPINGHEWDTSKTYPQANSDLQYACVFDLPAARHCELDGRDCDCTAMTSGTGPEQTKSPVCQDASDAYGTVQRRGKAYPSLRELQVARDLGPNGFAASICPATVSGDTDAPGYGYNPIVSAILELSGSHLRSR